MKFDKSKVNETISQANKLLKNEKNISPALRAVFELLLVMVGLFIDRLSLNSSNSSKPPSSDPNRKKLNPPKGKRKPGGQKGRTGKQLKPVKNPDKIESLVIDKRTLPKGNYTNAGLEKRQVLDFKVEVVVTEYQAQVLVDEYGKHFVAEFPKHVTRPIQYGPTVKAHAVYMSQYQLLPFQRVANYFSEQIGINISVGSLCNFNQEAFERLADFESIAKDHLEKSHTLHVDETGINVNGKRIWLHTVCTKLWTFFYPHKVRGGDAIEDIGIIPNFQGVLTHDHWKPYYKYDCKHALCNAHHLRELEWSASEDSQKWAAEMKAFLISLNVKVEKDSGKLSLRKIKNAQLKYRAILSDAQTECPEPKRKTEDAGKRGRIKRSKSRNLLERLIKYEEDTLRFMTDIDVPFTNNQGENDLRMTKVQQKISGCFRSMDGAYNFCRNRSFLHSCRKHDVNPTEALLQLFQGSLPDFVNSS